MYVNKQPRRVKNIQLLKNSRFYVFDVSTTFQKSNSIFGSLTPTITMMRVTMVASFLLKLNGIKIKAKV